MIAEDRNGKTEPGMAALCTKLKAQERKQRGWPYLPDATDSLDADAALMREMERQC